VEDIRRADGGQQPASLAVLEGNFGARRLIIDVSQVKAVVPGQRCVLLDSEATIARIEPRE
jgi:hypothetical protein